MNYQILKIRLSQIMECISDYTSEASIRILLEEGKKALRDDNIEVLKYVINEFILWYSQNIIKIRNNEFVTNYDVHYRNTSILPQLLELIEKENFDIPIDNRMIEVKEKSLNNLMRIIDRFHLIAKQLRNRYNSRDTLDISDEYDVQDLLHSLLYIYFDDVRAEEWTPSYAGKCARQDFLLKNEDIVIEVKKTRNGLSAKELGEQLIIDIARYKSHPNCKNLVCFVYDPE